MARVKYRIGDKVSFKFLGKYEEGVIEEITNENINFSKYKDRYHINDGKYRYPVVYENIERKVK